MKAIELVDDMIDFGNRNVIVELPNGVQMVTTESTRGYNKKGELFLVIKAGRKLTGHRIRNQ